MDIEVFGTASSAKGGVVASFGAHFIDYTNEDFAVAVRALTGDGVDVVFDPIGGSNLARSMRILQPGGLLVSYGFSAVANVKHPTLAALRHIAALRWQSISTFRRQALFYRFSTDVNRAPERYRQTLTTLVHKLDAGTIQPLAAQQLPLERAGDAHDLLERGEVRGKILLNPNLG